MNACSMAIHPCNSQSSCAIAIVPLGFLQVALLRVCATRTASPMNESDLADTRTYSRGELRGPC